MTRTLTDDQLSTLAAKLRAPGVRWRTYPNPMRDDGLFVAEDKPIYPYPDTVNLNGQPIYPATPATPHELWGQLPHADAEALVKMLNEEAANNAAGTTLDDLDKLLAHWPRNEKGELLRPGDGVFVKHWDAGECDHATVKEIRFGIGRSYWLTLAHDDGPSDNDGPCV